MASLATAVVAVRCSSSVAGVPVVVVTAVAALARPAVEARAAEAVVVAVADAEGVSYEALSARSTYLMAQRHI